MILYSEYLQWNEANDLKLFALPDDLETQYGGVITPLIKNFISVEDPFIVRVRVRTPYLPSGNPPIDDSDRRDAVSRTWDKLNVFFWSTAPYYGPLLKAYQDNIDKLMTGLTETRKDTNSRNSHTTADHTRHSGQTGHSTQNDTGTRGESDTPTSATFSDFPAPSDNLSFGEQSKSDSTVDSNDESNEEGNEERTTEEEGNASSTREYDTRYTIDKLNELRTKYKNLMKDWYNEFYKEFAVAEANIW